MSAKPKKKAPQKETSSAPEEENEFLKIINPSDFRSVELEVNLENLTTRVSIKDGKKVYGDKADKLASDQQIQFVEFLEEEGMILECPPNSGASGHNLELHIKVKNAETDHELDVLGHIVEVEKLENKNQRVTVKLSQFESADWFALKRLFSKRQEEVLEFFKSVKGY